MTRDAFTAALQEQLRIRGHTFSRAAVLAFVEAAWPLIEDGSAVLAAENERLRDLLARVVQQVELHNRSYHHVTAAALLDEARAALKGGS
jgi:hypothetical protein